MRILAVRGRNLASLAEPFEIDLSAEPIAGAGLFAITGETGAGKSTLLDALCLALYGDFPRISEGSDQDLPDAGDEIVKAKDPRNILRKGAARGHAEVDFIGVDGRLYRAHWGANRAHGRPGGRLQPPVRHLVRLDAAGAVAETIAEKSAVTRRVCELTDLTFDQFRRTVVLAQGEFDAFLAANDAERADLLEKITGTEIYARLSVAAFEAARTAREAVERARERLAAVGVMEPEVRAERLARRDAVRAERAARAAEAETAAAILARHDRATAARDLAARAEEARATAQTARDAARPERVRLSAIERAAALKPVFDRLAEARRTEAAAGEALDEAKQRLDRATPSFGETRLARDAADAALRAEDAEIARLRPIWEEAARLDERVAAAAAERAAAEEPARTAAAEREALRGDLATLSDRRAAVVARLARLVAERERRPEIAAFAERWTAVGERLAERRTLRIEIATAETAARDRARRAAEADAARAAAGAAVDAHRDRRATLEADLAAARTALADLRDEETTIRDEALAALAGTLAEILPLAREARAARTLAATAEADLAAARAQAEAAEAAQGPAAGERDALARRLAEGAAAGRLAAALETAEAEHLRAGLLDGAPCPVCGATEHPILTDPGIRAALEALRAERADLETRRAALDDHLATLRVTAGAARARETTHAATRADALARATAAESVLADALRRIDAEIARLGLAVAPTDADPTVSLPRLAEEIAEARRPLAARRAEAARLRTATEAARDALAALDTAREADAVALAARTAEAAAADRDRALAEAAFATARQALETLDARLAPDLAPLALDPIEFDERGDELAGRLATAVAGHRARLEEEAKRLDEEKALEREVLALAAALERAERTHDLAAATLAGATSRHAALLAERALLLDGRPTAAHLPFVAVHSRSNAFNPTRPPPTAPSAWNGSSAMPPATSHR